RCGTVVRVAGSRSALLAANKYLHVAEAGGVESAAQMTWTYGSGAENAQTAVEGAYNCRLQAELAGPTVEDCCDPAFHFGNCHCEVCGARTTRPVGAGCRKRKPGHFKHPQACFVCRDPNA